MFGAKIVIPFHPKFEISPPMNGKGCGLYEILSASQKIQTIGEKNNSDLLPSS